MVECRSGSTDGALGGSGKEVQIGIVQTPSLCAHQQRFRRKLVYCRLPETLHSSNVLQTTAVHLERIAIEAAQSVLRGYPEEAATIVEETIAGVLGKPLGSAMVLEPW